MKKKAAKEKTDMLPEYDFSKGIRGEFAQRYAEGTNLILLAPDLAEIFPDSESVNAALRSLVKLARKSAKMDHGSSK